MNFVKRNLAKVFNIVTGKGSPSVEKDMDEILELLTACVEAKGGEVSARMRAAEMVRYYMVLDDNGRRQVLHIIARNFGPDPVKIKNAFDNYVESIGTPEEWEAEFALKSAVQSGRSRILTQFNTINMGVRFLVDLRTDLLEYMKDDPELVALDRDLKKCLISWFDVAFLELRRITWDTPASILEKLIEYEAVHEMNSWDDLKNRLDSDRRCYAFFHPHMPEDPLIFVQVALVKSMADNVQKLLDINAPLSDINQADTAVFYSITSTQQGLREISFGNFLLKRVINSLEKDFPKLKTFATLSPIPGFMRWLQSEPEILEAACSASGWKNLAKAGISGTDDPVFREIISSPENFINDISVMECLKEPLMRTAAYYLTRVKQGTRPIDSVTRFHLGNGAGIGRLNWMADNSPRGLKQSCGIMVNYVYDSQKLEDNIEAFASGHIDASSAINKMASFIK